MFPSFKFLSDNSDSIYKINNKIFTEIEFLNKTVEASRTFFEVKKLRALIVLERKEILKMMVSGNRMLAKEKVMNSLIGEIEAFNLKQSQYIEQINEGSHVSSKEYSAESKFTTQLNNCFFLAIAIVLGLFTFFKLK